MFVFYNPFLKVKYDTVRFCFFCFNFPYFQAPGDIKTTQVVVLIPGPGMLTIHRRTKYAKKEKSINSVRKHGSGGLGV